MVGTLLKGSSLNGVSGITRAHIRCATRRVVLGTAFAGVWFVALYFWHQLIVEVGGVLNGILWIICLLGSD